MATTYIMREDEEKQVRGDFLDRVKRLTTLHEITEKINFPALLLYQLQLIQISKAEGNIYAYQCGVEHLENMIPTSWKESDEKYLKAVEELVKTMDKAEQECERRNEQAEKEGEWDSNEDDAPYEVKYDIFYDSLFTICFNLMDRKGILMQTKTKEVLANREEWDGSEPTR